MERGEIFISLAEAESLFLNDILLIPNYSRRIKVKNRNSGTKDFLTKLSYDYILFLESDTAVFTKSCVKELEVVEIEESFYRNQLKIPGGLMKSVERKNYSLGQEVNLFSAEQIPILVQKEESEKAFLFRRFRNGLMTAFTTSLSGVEWLEKFETLLSVTGRDYVYYILKPIFQKGDFGKIPIANNFSIALERLGYLIKHIKSIPENILSQDRINALMEWLKVVVKSRPSNLEAIKTALKQAEAIFPNNLKDTQTFFERLLIFAVAKEELSEESNDLKLEDISNDTQREIILWDVFLTDCLAKDGVPIYFIESLSPIHFALDKYILYRVYHPEEFNSNSVKFSFPYFREDFAEGLSDQAKRRAIAEERARIFRKKILKRSHYVEDVQEYLQPINKKAPTSAKSINLIVTIFKEFKFSFKTLKELNKFQKPIIILNVISRETDIFSMKYASKIGEEKDKLSLHLGQEVMILSIYEDDKKLLDLSRNLKIIFNNYQIKTKKELLLYYEEPKLLLLQSLVRNMEDVLLWEKPDRKNFYYVPN